MIRQTGMAKAKWRNLQERQKSQVHTAVQLVCLILGLMVNPKFEVRISNVVWSTMSQASRHHVVQSAPEPSKSSSSQSHWVDSDFPRSPPEGCNLSSVQWRSFKACMIKGGVPPQDLSDEQLRATGCNSWKEYIIATWPMNWE